MHILAKTAATAVALALGTASVSAEGKLVIYHWFEYIP
ncbi:MAG: ABC transporter substrate-binding protein, partial [Boseongicola sp. SB0675_bin_26]|nr:ABC transporter substrate-binding protein [Boseongicola sp. SB0675_bin_26]